MIIHFTTVHPRDDSRIRDKELASLAKALNAPVALFVMDGLPDETDRRAGFPVVSVGPPLPRLRRMTAGGYRMYQAVRRAKPAVAQFHDPELLPWAWLLAMSGIKVVYDIHEDVPQQVLHNHHVPSWAKRPVSIAAALVEKLSMFLLAGFAPATPVIAKRFPQQKSVIVRNYPILDELAPDDATPIGKRNPWFGYVGTINQNRNFVRMIDAVDNIRSPEARLRLAGQFMGPSDRAEAEARPGWSKVIYDPWLDREGVAKALGEILAGLCLLKPVPHEMVTLPIKLFEYMAAGVPVIVSDFPLWRKIVEDAQCGLLVDPENTTAITEAMEWMIAHPAEAQEMGERGRRAAVEKYSWDAESRNLVSFYETTLGYSAVSA